MHFTEFNCTALSLTALLTAHFYKQAVTPTQPMPDEEEVNMKFAELVVSRVRGKEGLGG